MAFEFEFKVVTGASGRRTAKAKSAIKASLRELNKKLEEIGFDNQIELRAMFGRDGDY